MNKTGCQVYRSEPIALLNTLTRLALRLHTLSIQAEAYIHRPVAPMDRELQRLSARFDRVYTTAVQQNLPLGRTFRTVSCSGKRYQLTLTPLGIELNVVLDVFTPCPNLGHATGPNRSRRVQTFFEKEPL